MTEPVESVIEAINQKPKANKPKAKSQKPQAVEVKVEAPPELRVRVYRVLMHQALTFAGRTETTLYANKTRKQHSTMEMWYTKDGVWCKYENLEFIVPLANVIAAFTTDDSNK